MIIDNSRVTLQIVASLTDDSRGVIYNLNSTGHWQSFLALSTICELVQNIEIVSMWYRSLHLGAAFEHGSNVIKLFCL
jgi:hypothetical protein